MKHRILTSLILLIAFSAALYNTVNSQSLDKISRRCPSPNGNVYGTILVGGTGDITHKPCPSKASIFTGIVDFSGATVIGGSVTGSGTATFLPIWSSASVLGNSPISWNGTLLNANVGTAIIGNSALANINIGNANADIIRIGGSASTSGQLFVDGTTTSTSNIWGIPSTGSIQLGSSNASNAARLTLNRSTNTITVLSPTLDMSTGTVGVSNFKYQRTITAGGTTGNQTINLPVGTVNFAAAATAITITNSTVSATSIIFATTRTNDTTCSVKNAIPGAGSFVINMTAACTAETSVGFFVTN